MPKEVIYRRDRFPRGNRRGRGGRRTLDRDREDEIITVSRRTLREMVEEMAADHRRDANTARQEASSRPAASHYQPKREVVDLAKKMALFVKTKRALQSWFLGMPNVHSTALTAWTESIIPPGDLSQFREELKLKADRLRDETIKAFRNCVADQMNDAADSIRKSPEGDREEAIKIAVHRLKREYPSSLENFDEMIRRLLPDPRPTPPRDDRSISPEAADDMEP